MSDVKLFKLRFKTANKTVDEVKASYGHDTNNLPSQELLEQITQSYQALNGVEIIGAKFGYHPDTYSLFHFEDDVADKIKEFMYASEQDEFYGSYVNEREQFEKDWAAGEYEPFGALHFPNDDFEVIEELQKKVRSELDE